jgi:pimeloyl-ACP methyl ester carboxylesterase
MKKLNRIIFVTVFGSLLIGKVYAQCDTLKDATFSAEYKYNPNDFKPPGMATPVPDPPPPPDPNEVRRIYFIHGLGGSSASWAKTAMACQYNSHGPANFPARKCEADFLPNYTDHTNSLRLATNKIRTEISAQAQRDSINGNAMKRSRAIVIAHSQGGVIAREMMHLDMVADTNHSTLHFGMNYGGVVTVASPLQGARILNNRHLILQMANDACNKITAGYRDEIARQISDQIPLFNIKSKLADKLGALMEGFCDAGASEVLPMFFNAYYEGITESYKVGSYINTLDNDIYNAKYSKFPKMAFYAIEPQTNLFWRTFNWTLKEPNNVGTVAFQANDDWDLLDNTIMPIYNTAVKKAEEHYAEYTRLSEKSKRFFIGAFVSGKKLTDEYKSYVAWSQGLEWFNNANEPWQTIIGAKSINWHKNLGGDPWGEWVERESDGVVLAESAADMPGATHAPVKISEKGPGFDGSSHMQVRNDEGLRKHLNALFDGDYHPYFKVFEQ